MLFGERNALLQHAREVIEKNSSIYINRIWGETEFGGTSVLYISDIDLAVMGWPGENTEAIPTFTEPLIKKTPFIGATAAGCLVGLNWIIKRRIALAGKNEEKSGNQTGKHHV
jgi:formate dehydrogenase iron-sulfur subunit